MAKTTFEEFAAERGILLQDWQVKAGNALLAVIQEQQTSGTGKTFLLDLLRAFINVCGNDFAVVQPAEAENEVVRPLVIGELTTWAIDQVIEELRKAEEKHPSWPVDQVHAVSIMSEEVGKAVRAANDYEFFDHGQGQINELANKLARSGAMVVRCLENLKAFVRGL